MKWRSSSECPTGSGDEMNLANVADEIVSSSPCALLVKTSHQSPPSNTASYTSSLATTK